jgi:hypothetical protein
MKVSTSAFVALIAAALAVTLCPNTASAAGSFGAQEPTLAEPYQRLERYADDQRDAPDTSAEFDTMSDAADAPTPAKAAPRPDTAKFVPQPDTARLVPQPAPEAGCEGCESGCGCDGDEGWCCRPKWTFRADGLLLYRSHADSRTLVSTTIGHNELLNTSDLKFRNEPGFRLGFARRLGTDWDVEVVYLQADSFDARGTVFAPGPISFHAPNVSVTAFGGTGMDFSYNSRLYSTEVNLKRYVGPGLALIGGFRWIELSEDFTGSAVDGAVQHPFWITDVNNHMYGMQVGAQAKIWDRGGPLSVVGTGKAGVYYNDVDQASDLPSLFHRHEGASKNNTSFVGELEIMAVYQISRHVALRGGYEMLWLGSVALAPEQIDTTDFGRGVAAVNTSGDAFYHGFLGGLEVTW